MQDRRRRLQGSHGEEREVHFTLCRRQVRHPETDREARGAVDRGMLAVIYASTTSI